MQLRLSQDPDADALISSDDFALLVGMVLDQQVPLEWAFAAPLELKRRLGPAFDPARLAAMDPTQLVSVFSAKPALHRYPGSMASRVHELARLVVERYGGRAGDVWKGAATGVELFDRIRELPGFGEQKAKIFVALLGKQLGVRPAGWEAVSAPFSDNGSTRSVADIRGPESLARVRAFKAEAKAAHKRAQAGARVAKTAAPTKKATAKSVGGRSGTAKSATAKSPAKAVGAKRAALSRRATPSGSGRTKTAAPTRSATAAKARRAPTRRGR